MIASAIGIAALVLLIGVGAPASAAPPVSSINLTCKKLAAATNPPASFPVAVSRHNPAVNDEIDFGRIPDSNIVQSAGGLACEWSNGLPLDPITDTGAVGVYVHYLPYGADGYWRFRGVPAGTAPSETFDCVTISVTRCQFMTAAGGDWLTVELTGATSESVASDLGHRMSIALELGQKTPFVLPVYAHPVADSCAAVIRPSVFRAAVGSPVPLVPDSGMPGWGPMESAELINHAVFCDVYDSTGEHAAGSIQTLPGGRWAFAIMRSDLVAPGPLTPITVPAMRTGDLAFTRCDAAHSRCVLDALIATHWVEVDLWTAARGADLITRDRLAATRPLLAEIVHQIYTP